MILVIALLVLLVWALWVAHEVTKNGGYPPYQDSTQRGGCGDRCCGQGDGCCCKRRAD